MSPRRAAGLSDVGGGGVGLARRFETLSLLAPVRFPVTAESGTGDTDEVNPEDAASDDADEDVFAGRTGAFAVSTAAERRDAFAVRRAVFVDEQGVDESIEWDEHDDPDASATHFVAYDDGNVVGAARLRSVDTDTGAPSTGKVERVAVVAGKRREGWGRRVMGAVEASAREAGFDRLLLHAQTSVRGFYDRLDYDAFGETFVEAGIPHVRMEKDLEADRR
jgi:predicted GNAT family N-acyltransferase